MKDVLFNVGHWSIGIHLALSLLVMLILRRDDLEELLGLNFLWKSVKLLLVYAMVP